MHRRRYIASVWPRATRSRTAAARVRLPGPSRGRRGRRGARIGHAQQPPVRAAGGPPDKNDRKAYLEEQIQRQKRGEPIDVEWVTEELQRIRREQIARIQTSQRNLRWIVTGAAILMLVLWARSGGVFDRGGFVTLA